LGLRKKTLILFAILIVTPTLWDFLHLPSVILNGLGFGMSGASAVTVNYAYYLKKVKGQEGWNPFKGYPFF
jgi:hypothetical protein